MSSSFSRTGALIGAVVFLALSLLWIVSFLPVTDAWPGFRTVVYGVGFFILLPGSFLANGVLRLLGNWADSNTAYFALFLFFNMAVGACIGSLYELAKRAFKRTTESSPRS